MRRGALPALTALSALVLLAPAAAAENLASMEASAGETPVIAPGQQGEGRLDVRYCYATSPIAPANVAVTVVAAPPWLTANPSPSSFRADTGGQRCGEKQVALQLTVGRGAPAFKPEPLRLKLAGPGEEVEVTAIVQAGFWAEVEVKKPPTARAARGDEGSFTLEVAVAANEATRLEVTGRDPQGLFNLLGHSAVVPGAGTGLDNKVTQRLPFRFTVGPAAPTGMRPFPVLVATFYQQGPSTTGESETLQVDVEVTGGGGPTPGPGVALLALGAAGAAVLARRRAR